MGTFIDLTGNKFGRLSVINRAPTIDNRTMWFCQCDCGNTTIVNSYNLKHKDDKKRVQSCGCYQKQRAKETATKHGMTHTIEWWLFTNAKKRAKEQGIIFNLTIEDIKVPKLCPLLNIPLFRAGKIITDNSPSLDKIIPDLGYISSNIQVISYKANAMKNNATFKEFETMYLNWKKQCH